MAKTMEQIMADMAAQGITISTHLAPGRRDGNSPAEIIRDAAKAQGIHYGDEDDA